MAEIFSFLMILIYSVLYGITMKTADLLNEHGHKWFKGSNILFGFICGIFGALLVMSNVYVANVLLAMVVAFIIRMRIDYRNHAIATVIIILSFLFYSALELQIFIVFLIIFAVFGSIKDLLDDYWKRKDLLQKVFETGWYYPIPTFIYSIYTNQWIVFYVFTLYIISYDIIKYWKEK